MADNNQANTTADNTVNPNSNSGKPTSQQSTVAAVSLTPNVTNARIYTRAITTQTERMKAANDEWLALRRKPRGQLTKDEIVDQLKKISNLGNDGDPLQGFEFMHRQSLFLDVIDRGSAEGLITPQEIGGYKLFMQAGIGAMAMSGGGAKTPGQPIPRTGPELPRTTGVSVPLRPPANNGVVILQPHIKFSSKISAQKQARHLKGSAPPEKSYLDSSSDAQKVLDAAKNGNAEVISMDATKNSIVVRVPEVNGTYVNIGNPNGLPDVVKPTNIFMIQGGDKVVPINPAKGVK